MNKLKFYATYNGKCYVKSYGRKFYKKGVELINIENCNGKIIIEKVNMAITKALEKCLDLANGTKIEFEAVLIEDKISYISNVRVLTI